MQQYVNNKFSVVKFQNVKAGEYYIKMLIDENKNGCWDNGNFNRKSQPEKVFIYSENIIVRDNWILNVNWEVTL